MPVWMASQAYYLYDDKIPSEGERCAGKTQWLEQSTRMTRAGSMNNSATRSPYFPQLTTRSAAKSYRKGMSFSTPGRKGAWSEPSAFMR